MNPSNVKEEATKLVKGLTSLDPIEYNGAINQYFQPFAAIDNSLLLLTGVHNIKQFTALQARLAESSELVGEPEYDESKNLVHFTFKRTFKTPPVLPSLPIIGSYFAGEKGSYPCRATLQLVPDDGQKADSSAGDNKDSKQIEAPSQKLVVSKLAMAEAPQPPLLNKLAYGVLRPFFSIVAIALSTIASFYYRHVKDSWLAMAFAAISESYNGLWKILGDEKSKRGVQANQWRDAKGEDLRKLIEQAKTTGGNLQTNLEAQAKARGIPVEQYKQQAEAMMDDLSQKVSVATHYFEEQAGTASAYVKENVNAVSKQAREMAQSGKERVVKEGQNAKENAKQYTDEAQESAKDVASETQENAKDYADKASDAAKDYAKETRDNVDTVIQSANDQETSHHDETDEQEGGSGSRTPLGGTDPTAAGAPSYAEAVKE